MQGWVCQGGRALRVSWGSAVCQLPAGKKGRCYLTGLQFPILILRVHGSAVPNALSLEDERHVPAAGSRAPPLPAARTSAPLCCSCVPRPGSGAARTHGLRC